jgi:hypothetical protein
MFGSSDVPVCAAELRALLSRLGAPVGQGGDAELLAEIEVLERLKGACAARQARLSVAFDESQRAQQRVQGVPARRVGRGVGEQVALARRESPSQGSRHLGLAKALVREMPHALAALARGDISEWTATVAVRESACLAADDRRRVDAELAGGLASSGPGQVGRAAWAVACRLDPQAAVNRHAKAVNDRRVSVRPAPDAMTYLTALVPVKDGVAVYAALTAAAASARAAGDPRGRGQLMADELVTRLTTTPPAAATAPRSTVEVCVVITDEALLGGGEEPARVTTSGAHEANPAEALVPAAVARAVVGEAERAWVRRLYARPGTGDLVAMESTRRVYSGNLRRMLVLRDRVCRTPWCQAPVRHADHVRDHAEGGPTSLASGQGLCERCNQTKNLPGWRAQVVRAGPAHVVRTTTPTGRHYDSTAPPLLSTG